MNNKGFTLIELIVVIVILGILAVTAVPKYINLKADAQTSTLQGVKAAIEGASALVYGKSIVAGNQKLASSNDPKPTITLTDGTVLDIHYGYPKTDKDDWSELLDLSSNDFLMINNADDDLIILPSPKTFAELNQSHCRILYQASALGEKPIITVFPCE